MFFVYKIQAFHHEGRRSVYWGEAGTTIRRLQYLRRRHQIAGLATVGH